MLTPQSPQENEDLELLQALDAEGQQANNSQSFGQMKVVSNGQTYEGLDQLPPEARQKVQAALEKLKSNPGLFNMIGAFTDIAKTSAQFGATQITGQNKEQIKSMLKGLTGTNNPNVVETMSVNADSQSSANPRISAESPEHVSTMRSNSYAQLNEQRSISPTFNPNVKSDNFRRNIFVVAALIIIGYLVFKFGFNGQLPF